MKNLSKINPLLAYFAIVFLNLIIDFGHKIIMRDILSHSFSGKTEFLLNLLLNLSMLLPFIMFFSAFGYVNDRISKTSMIKFSSFLSLLLSFGMLFAYFFASLYAALFFVFLFSLQSALFSPAKYGIIKALFQKKSLLPANAFVQVLTILAFFLALLLIHDFSSKVFIEHYEAGQRLQAFLPLALLFFFLSALEFFSSYHLPILKADSNKRIKHLTFKYSFFTLKEIFSNKSFALYFISLSLFWAFSHSLILAFPIYYKIHVLQENRELLKIIFFVLLGFSSGAFLTSQYSKNRIELGLIPFGTIGIFWALIILACSKTTLFFSLAGFLYALGGALFIIPLYSAIEFFSDNDKISKNIAVLNFLQALSILFFLILTAIFIHLKIDLRFIFLFLAFLLCFIIIIAIKEVPNLFFRLLLVPVLRLNYKLDIDGIENFPKKGGILLLGNHISFLDWIVLQIALPRPIKFVMQSFSSKWYFKFLLEFFKVIEISSFQNEKELEQVKHLLNKGEVVAIFPENHISYNGQLGEFHKDFEAVAKDTKCQIIPFYIRGLWGSSFSRAIKSFKEVNKHSRAIRISFGQAMKNTSNAVEVKKKVRELSFFSWGKYLSSLQPLQYNWLKQAKSKLSKKALIDSTGADLSNFKMLATVLLLLKKTKKRIDKEKNIGVILPPSAIASLINLVIFIRGKIPVNLNYTLSKENLLASMEKAEIKTILSSRKFLNRLKNKGFDIENLLQDKVIYMEDLSKKISKKDKISASLLAFLAPAWLIRMLYFKKVNIDDDATIIFSSGSENQPKGIVLTHKNLLSNVKQIADILGSIDVNVILSSLPLFHSFGLTVTTLLPLNEGIMSVNVADPTDAYEIGKMTAKYQATVLFGTSTFFRIYNKSKKLNPLMFASLRIVVCGAEKLKEEVKKEFKIKFGIEILEGYGTTETSPVVSCNMPNALEPENFKELVFNKVGSVGLPLPGTVIKIVDEESFHELPSNKEGLILIGGHQVMKAYYKDELKTESVISHIDGLRYYNSGDIGYLDDDGFLTITDRKLRFAKISGEMLSLANIEREIEKILGEDFPLLAINLEDEKKGEKIVLLYNKEEFEPEEIKEKLRLSSLAPLMLPSKIYKVEQLPLLGSGKADFKGAKILAQKLDKESNEKKKI